MARTVDMQVRIGELGTRLPVIVSLASTDYTVLENMRGISSVGGTVVFVTVETAVGALADIPIATGSFFPLSNIKLVKKTGTDATYIVLWPRE